MLSATPAYKLSTRARSVHTVLLIGARTDRSLPGPEPLLPAGVADAQPDCICPMVYSPVCGANNVEYGNACEAGCVGVTDFKTGPCGGSGAASVRPSTRHSPFG